MSERIFKVPLIIRGQVIETDGHSHGGRGGGVRFESPAVSPHISRLAMANPSTMQDLYAIRFEEILEYLESLGERLSPAVNPWMEEAFELSCLTSGLGRDILRSMYLHMGDALRRESLREAVENTPSQLRNRLRNRLVRSAAILSNRVRHRHRI